MWKFLSKTYNNVDALLVALVLNVNVLRVFLGIQDTNLLLYMVYVLAMVAIVVKNDYLIRLSMKRLKMTKYILFFIVYLLLFSFISLTWINYNGAVITVLKFTVALVLAFLCMFFPKEKIGSIKIYFVGINVLYAIMFLLTPERVYSQMDGGMNYLNTTLTLGFSFSIGLVSMYLAYFEKKWLNMSIWVVMSALFFASIVGFAARGVLLFPPIILLILIPFIGKSHLGKTLIAFVIVFFLFSVAMQYFMDYASDYSVGRMTRLMEDAEDEDRIGLWRKCFDTMMIKSWFIFGGGIEAFRSEIFYPHNIFLQVLGEFGFVPFLIFVYILVRAFANFIRLNKMFNTVEGKNVLYFVVVGILYYLMTFSKSFSMYDALSFFIMLALMYALYLDKMRIKWGNIIERSNKK